ASGPEPADRNMSGGGIDVAAGRGRFAGAVAVRGTWRRVALGDADHGRAEQAVVQQIARLHQLNHGAGRLAAAGYLEHRLMQVAVELLAERLDLAELVTLERRMQLALRHLDAFAQRLQ